MKPSIPPLPPKPTRVLWLGTACCLLSAVCYTLTNICLRQLAAGQVDEAWVICVKEAVSVIVVGPWIIWLTLRGERFRLPVRAMAVLVGGALAVQWGGNLGIQWAFGINGLVISMPLVFGVMLVASAVLGILCFREFLRLQSVFSIGIVIASIALLAYGATGQAGPTNSSASTPNLSLILLAVGAACIGGVMFATLGVAIRYAAKAEVPIIVIVLVVTGVGMLSLGILCLARLGPSQLLATPPTTLIWMVAAGFFNLAGFILIIKGLQLTTLVHANLLNASQVALGAAAGLIFFHEPSNNWLLTGIALTVVAIATYADPRSKDRSTRHQIRSDSKSV